MKVCIATFMLFFCAALPVGRAEEFNLSTYYPAPNGQYGIMNVSGVLTCNVMNTSGAIIAQGLTASEGILLRRGGFNEFVVDNAGNVRIGGDLSMSGAAIVNVTRVTASGKIRSASTAAGDSGNTVATKDYVDSKMQWGINYGDCYWFVAGGGLYCSANHVIVGVNAMPTGGTFYDFLCCALK